MLQSVQSQNEHTAIWTLSLLTIWTHTLANMKNRTQNLVAAVLSTRYMSLLLAGLVATVMALPAAALELGHSRVASAPGQPLVVVVPIRNIAQSDISSLSVRLADVAQWQAAGLTPPVPLNTLSVNVDGGADNNSRVVRISSTQVSDQTVVDMLLAVSSASANRTLQTSIIVPPPPTVRLASETVSVQRGDTLIGIVDQFPVQGANLYQQLWAFYDANTDAFMRDNMNLLKAGASLRVPDADTVRAVDPAFAKAQYMAHVRAFRQGSGGGQGDLGIAADATAQTLQGQTDENQPKDVEPAQAEPAAPVNDQVRLTSDTTDTQTQADAAVSAQKQMAEETDRQQALEQNIDSLQGAIAQSANGTQSESDSTASDQVSSDQSSGVQTASDQTVNQASDDGQLADQAASDQKADTNVTSVASSTTAQDTSSSNAFARLGQWITDNTTAAIAILLAIIALILAWALRASKNKPVAEVVEPKLDQASASFEEKLKDIDLSLDDKPAQTQPKSDAKD